MGRWAGGVCGGRGGEEVCEECFEGRWWWTWVREGCVFGTGLNEGFTVMGV